MVARSRQVDLLSSPNTEYLGGGKCLSLRQPQGSDRESVRCNAILGLQNLQMRWVLLGHPCSFSSGKLCVLLTGTRCRASACKDGTSTDLPSSEAFPCLTICGSGIS